MWELSLKFNLSTLYVEPDRKDFEHLLMNMQQHRPLSLVEAFNEVVRPEGILSMIARSRIVDSVEVVDLLKIDIDVNDCDVAQELLHQRRVSILLMEVNPIPPPVRFAQHSTHPPIRAVFPVHGCSLSYMVD